MNRIKSQNQLDKFNREFNTRYTVRKNYSGVVLTVGIVLVFILGITLVYLANNPFCVTC